MGGFSKGGSAPVYPDPQKLADSQFDLNKRTALLQASLNRVGQYTPYGSMTYQPTGKTVNGVPEYKQVMTLNPQMQAMLSAQNKEGLSLMRGIGAPLNMSGLPTVNPADAAGRKRVEDALYARETARLNPMYAQQETALDTKLANQGFDTNSTGYNTAVSNFRHDKNDAYANAVNDAILAGGQEQSRIFGVQSSDRQRALQELLTRRTQPLNEYMAMMGGGGVQMPQFSQAPQTGVSPSDITTPTMGQFNAQENQYQQQQNQNNGFWGSLFGLGGNALGAWLGG